MNKKGILQFFLLIVFFLLMSYAVFTFTGANFITLKRSIGEKQVGLVEKYQMGEALLFYIDQSAKYSSFIAIDNLAGNGGFYNEDCKEDNLYFYSVKCNPAENLDKNFIVYFNSSFNNLIKNYPTDIPSDYSYSLDKENSIITGRANKDINFEIGKDTTYLLKADFRHKFNYNLDDYGLIYNEVKNNINCLKTNKDCFNNKYDFQWNIKRENNLVKFDVVTNQSFVNINDKFIKKPVVVRFAVNLDKFDEK